MERREFLVVGAATVAGLGIASWTFAGEGGEMLKLQSVKDAIARARPLVAGFVDRAVTTPVWGIRAAGEVSSR